MDVLELIETVKVLLTLPVVEGGMETEVTPQVECNKRRGIFPC